MIVLSFSLLVGCGDVIPADPVCRTETVCCSSHCIDAPYTRVQTCDVECDSANPPAALRCEVVDDECVAVDDTAG